jgi:gluconolactonase
MNDDGASRRFEATLFTRLPERLHFRGEPTPWVRLTRPGERLHSFLEGPCFDAKGDLWLVDVPHGRIFRVTPEGDWHVALEYEGEPHALRPRGDGTFLVADHKLGLLAFDPEGGKVDILIDRVESGPFRGLGDLAVAPNGDVWLTDPGRSSLSDPTGRVLRLRKDARKLEIVLPTVPYPNGIALSPDCKLVYVSATRANAVWRFLADAPDPGWPMAGTFIQLSGGLGPDGLAVDTNGRLAVTQAQAGRLYLFDTLGDPVATILTPGGLWTTACAFSPDQSSIYILEARTGGIYRSTLPVAPSSPATGL